MDDDTVTRENLKEDKVNNAGCLPKDFTGIILVTYPIHRKCAYSKHLYKLVNTKVGELPLTSAQAKIITNNFGYFRTQIKNGTLEEVEAMQNFPMNHVSGNHDHCGDWFLAGRSKTKNRTYNHPPLFDLSKPDNNKTFQQVQEIHHIFTTTKNLIETMQPSTTQVNEYLNMCKSELAPKYKKYSRTISLNLRINFVVG